VPPRVAAGMYLAILGGLLLLSGLVLLGSRRFGNRAQATPFAARYMLTVLSTVAIVQGLLALVPAVIALTTTFGDTARQRVLLYLPGTLGLGMWFLALRHLKHHPSQQRTVEQPPPGPTA
jgi:Ca2+/H+ antiporter